MKSAMQELEQTAKAMSKLSGDSGFVGRSILSIIENESLLEKEKQQIIDAVNYQDKKCIAKCNIAIERIMPDCKIFFEHDENESLEYYNEKFKQ